MKYECYRCGWTTHIKTKMTNHLARKRECKCTFNDIELDDCKKYILEALNYEEFQSQQQSAKKPPKNQLKSDLYLLKSAENKCKYCEKEFASYKNKWRHENKNCKEKKKGEEAKDSMDKLVKLLNEQMKEQNNQLKKELDKRDKQIKEQNKQIDELIKKAGINNSNITQNIQNNIKLLAYKDTDISNITDKDIRNCMNHSNMCVPYLIKMIHLDPKKPENHNVYISNLKNGYIMVYNGENWDTLSREEVIEDIINDRECLIQDRVEDWLENGKNYPIIMKKFERYLDKKEKNVVLNKIKEEIRFMLFNNRNMIKNSNPEKDNLVIVENN